MNELARHGLGLLYEDNHCIAVAKPAGMPSAHFEGTSKTADHVVKSYLKQKYQKPGQVFLGIVHRLDRPTSGVLLFARTSKAAARLSEQFRTGAIHKVYWAIVAGQIQPTSGQWSDSLLKDEAAQLVRVVAPDVPGAKTARTDFTAKMLAGHSWVELRPHTGRKHQLRVQLASRGHPVLGDTRYGSRDRWPHGIALHARQLTFLHPTQNSQVMLVAETPNCWPETLFPG